MPLKAGRLPAWQKKLSFGEMYIDFILSAAELVLLLEKVLQERDFAHRVEKIVVLHYVVGHRRY